MASGPNMLAAYSMETLVNDTAYSQRDETINGLVELSEIRQACIVGVSGESDLLKQPDSKSYFDSKSLLENFFMLDVVYSKTGEEYRDAVDVVFVFREFGNLLRPLQNYRCVSFQVLRVLRSINENHLSRLKPARPLYCFSMSSMGFALGGFQKHDIRRAVDLIHYMNGHVRRTFKGDLILIAKDTKSDHYSTAVSLSKRVLTMQWLEECWARRDDVSFVANDAELMDKYSLKCFGGLSLFFYGFQEDELREVRDRTENNGGAFVTKIAHATHVVVNGSDVGSISKDGFCSMGAQPEAFIVTDQWFWKSIHLGFCYKEELYNAVSHDVRSRYSKKSSNPVMQNKKRKSKGSSRSNLENSNTSGGMSELMYSTDSIDCAIPIPSKHNDKRYQVCLEMLDTEKNYCNSLDLIVKMFKEPLEAALNDENQPPIIAKREIQLIFGKIQPILLVHRNILSSLSLMMENWDSNYYGVKFGYAWAMHGPDLGKVYPSFVNSYDEVRQTLDDCLTRDKFLSFVKSAESDPKCRKITLKDMLIKPVQRLPSVVLLLNEILKRTDSKHQDVICLKRAIEEIESVLKNTNNSRRVTEQHAEFMSITREIESFPIALINSNRHFNNKVDLLLLYGDSLFEPLKGRVLTLFLFDDLVMFTKKRAFSGSQLNLSQSFMQNTKGTLQRNVSFLRGQRNKMPYKLITGLRINDFRIVRYDKSRELIIMKVRDSDDGDILIVGKSANDNFTEVLHFMNQLCTLVNQYNGRGFRMDELTPHDFRGMQESDSEDYRSIKKAIDVLQCNKPDPLTRRSSLRRAMSNISVNITHGIQRFTSRANLSFINENGSM